MLPELTKNGEAMIRLVHLILSWITFERVTTGSGQASKTHSAHNSDGDVRQGCHGQFPRSVRRLRHLYHQCCQMAKFDPCPLPSTQVQSKESKGSNFTA